MTKLALQKELLEKVKPGMKPSDIKRVSKNQDQRAFNPPLLSNKDEGYSSDEERKLDQNLVASKNQIKNPSSRYVLDNSNETKELQNQLTSLKKQLQVYKDFKDADLKIKERYKEQIKDLQAKVKEQDGIIADLQNTAKTPAEPKEPQETKTFLCSDCQQKKPHSELSRAFNNFSFCLACSKKARFQAQQEKSEPKEFICHTCQQTKQETPAKMKLDQTLQTYLICSSCRPTLKEFNEADLITDDLWAKYPYSSASEILEKEFGIVKEEPW